MAVSLGGKIWIFVIKTNKYAGNFERQLCAYITGVIGGCGVGAREQQAFCTEVDDHDKFMEFVDMLPHDDGCFRPVSIFGPDYNDVAIFFHQPPTDELIDLMISRARKYVTTWCPQAKMEWERHEIEILGFELQKLETVFTTEETWEVGE